MDSFGKGGFLSRINKADTSLICDLEYIWSKSVFWFQIMIWGLPWYSFHQFVSHGKRFVSKWSVCYYISVQFPNSATHGTRNETIESFVTDGWSDFIDACHDFKCILWLHICVFLYFLSSLASIVFCIPIQYG